MIDKKLIYNDLQALQSLCETYPEFLRDRDVRRCPEEWRDSTLRKVGKNIMRLCSKHYDCDICPLHSETCFRFDLPHTWGHYAERLKEF